MQRLMGRNVRELRRQQKLSQEQFGDQLEFHRTYIGGIERGERNLTLQTVERIGEALGVAPVSLLIDWHADEFPANPMDAAGAPRELRAAADGGDPGPASGTRKRPSPSPSA